MSVIKLASGNVRHVDDITEARARRTALLSQARALVERHCTPPRVPDLSKCASVPEVEWVKLGGDVEVYRTLTLGEEDAAGEALSSLEMRLTGKVSMTTPRREAPETTRFASVDDEVRDVLVRLGLDPDLASASTETEARAIIARKGKA